MKADQNTLPTVVAILGPTASGKTALAIELAKEYDLEVINCDSRQIYREMEIGTAKPSYEERKAVVHHLIDIVSPGEPFSAGDFVRLATSAINDIHSRGKLPLIVGGTGFYYDALVNGLPETASNEEIRTELQNRLEEDGIEKLLIELQTLDPVAAGRIDSSNPRRVLRALEVIKMSGKSFSEALSNTEKLNADVIPILVNVPRELLLERITKRIYTMLDLGLENEARTVYNKYGCSADALKIIGYREWWDYFEGHRSFDESVELINIHTRQYAKRQVTWFKKRPGGTFYDPREPGKIMEQLKAKERKE
ncbi:MAG: tRNA (adenosine(37)-N6)-dimethylallyltransferase MiaA [Candidatus Riflebacteria bacterium]|nr:tRNA (adenosine(37)-N6)-dimethylallyltransferase MiaA [Candidatus Riflebacteria bacterium]